MDGASAIQIVRPSEFKAETQPQLQPALLRLSATISQSFTRSGFTAAFPRRVFGNAGSERKGSQSGSSLKSAGVTPELTCERCASTASQVDRLVGHRNFNAQFLSKRSTIDWACFLREAKNF